jgi:broad specificity phosphatase PhoE
MIITYFVHSTTTDNESGVVTGWEDSPLSEKGNKQAAELHSLTADHPFDVVISSDSGRAIETATIAFNPLFLMTDWRLREINYGKYSKQPSHTVKGDLTKYINSPFPEGESYNDVLNRMVSLISDIKKYHQGKSVALVAHQAPQLALNVLIHGRTWEQAFQEDWRKTHAWQPGWTYEI